MTSGSWSGVGDFRQLHGVELAVEMMAMAS